MNTQKYKQVVILFIILIFSLPTVAVANGGPVRPNGLDPQGNGYLTFDYNSGIALEEEWVSYLCETGRANVNVIYNLKNTTDNEKDIEMVFVLSQYNRDNVMDSFKIYKNGMETEDCKYENICIPMKSSYITYPVKKMWDIIDPLSSKPISAFTGKWSGPDINSSDPYGLPVKMKFQPNESAQLTIKFIDIGGYYVGKEVKKPVSAHLYYLTPAKYWKGKPLIHLAIKFPQNKAYSIHSNIPMDTTDNINFSTTLKGIPNEEWLFSYVVTNDYSPSYLLLSIALILVVFISILFISKRIKTKHSNIER